MAPERPSAPPRWRRWLDQHRDALVRFTLPDFLHADESRWLRFLKHGGWDAETGGIVERFSPSQAAAFQSWVLDQYGPDQYVGLLRRLRLRAGSR